MGTHLHQALRTLCFNTQWKYAVFWKLKHRARMVLTWEDAYYDNHMQHNPPESTNWMVGNLSDWHSHDPLGLAVAKMSYHVYSLGEGVIGQVAVTGKHVWIFADKYITTSCSPFEHCDGWQAQFSAGIKTIVVVGIGPYGVVQLGSQNKILEELMLVNHIRDSFFALKDSSIGCTPSLMHCTMNSSSCLSDISTGCSCSWNFHDCISNLGRPANKTIICSPTFSSTEKPADCSYIVPSPGDLPKKTVEAINKDRRLELSTSRGDESANILQSRPESFLSEPHRQVQTKLHIDRCEEETSCCGHLGVSSEDHDAPSSRNFFKLPADDSGVDVACLHSNILNSAACSNQNGVLCMPEPLDMQIQKVLENIDIQTESNINTLNKPLKFSAGCELYEVLGPAFQKQNTYSDWETEKSVTETTIEMPEGMDSSCLLTADSGSEHLLEAVVANVCRSGTDIISEKSHCKSVKSLLTTEKIPHPNCETLTVSSAGYSFDQSLVEKDILHCLSSEACGASSSKGFSLRSQSTFSEQLDSTQEPPKVNKKRARPGESSRPRPRDRQLIQDRIKELRELVPNGSKCSIDSLLERTIKHMLFMQSITKHAEKLNKCTKSKLRDKETVVRGLSNYDQGSSWAMELGNHQNVFPIMVENISKNGQMLIEMFCDECSQFLELAEAIRILGLTVLKGVTEACGDKTWIGFVVEGRNNRNMHRMDILWSLVQILQPKTAN